MAPTNCVHLFQNNVIESEVTVPAKHHRHFVLQRGQVCREIGDEFGGVNISFPKEADSTRVIVKGMLFFKIVL